MESRSFTDETRPSNAAVRKPAGRAAHAACRAGDVGAVSSSLAENKRATALVESIAIIRDQRRELILQGCRVARPAELEDGRGNLRVLA